MIEANEIFSENDKRIAILCDGAFDKSDLASIAENIIISGVDLISVVPEMVTDMWVYLEKTPVKILTRYNFDSVLKNMDVNVSDLVKNTTTVFKRGAGGVQIFLKMSVLKDFVEKMLLVRDDLFFDKELCMGFDICDIDVKNVDVLFEKLNEIGAKSFALTLDEDMGNRSDFVGRIYTILQNWNFKGDIYFLLNNNFDRIDQVIRLIESMKPELSDRVKFFLEY